MRTLAIVFGLSAALFGGVGTAADSTDGVPRRPNVVVFLADDLGTLDARCFGSPDLVTPTIDRLARDGVRLTQCYAHTVCCPGRAMVMTGRYPQRCDLNSWAQGETTDQPKGRNLKLSEWTLAEAMRDAGYATAIFGKWHLGAARTHGPTRQGFDEFFGIRGGFIDNYVHFSLHGRGRHDLFERDEEIFRRGDYFMEMVTDRAEAFIDANHDQPFFLYFPLNLPHYPEQSIAKFEHAFESLAEPRRSYAKIVATTDHFIGRVMSKLDQHGLADQTIVAFGSDNGHSNEDYQISVDDHLSGLPRGLNYGANAGGGNTGTFRGAKGSFLEGGLRVPAIVSYPPKLPRGEVRDQLTTLMDFMPTILELTGVEAAGPTMDGQSLVPICVDNAETTYDEMHWQWQNGWAVRRGPWKLIVGGTLGLSGSGKDRLSNDFPDPFLGRLDTERPESENFVDEQPGVVKELTQAHRRWLEDVAL